MKQKRHNKKVINWHRSLRSWRRRGWYRRQQEAIYDPAVVLEENRAAAGDVDCFDGVDIYWNAYDPYGCPCCRGDRRRDDSDDLYRVALSNLLEHLLGRPRLELPQPQPLAISAADADEAAREPCAADAKASIETRLYSHLERVEALNAESAPRLNRQIGACIDRRDIERLKNAAGELSYHFVKQVCLFAPFWLRPPRSWKPGSAASLLDHLFARHEVPQFLYKEWFEEREVPRLKWLCWFILFAQNGSLKRAAKLFNWSIGSGFAASLFAAPQDLSPVEACIFAEVKSLGGSELDFVRIIRDPAFVIDPTQPAEMPTQNKFWRDTVRWLVAHSGQIPDIEWNFILPWAMHEHAEAQRGGRRPFSWTGRTVRAVIERARRYHQIMRDPYIDHHWAGHGWDWQWQDSTDCTWSFVELTSSEELYIEGNTLHHCVASYGGRCVLGQSAIVSLRKNSEPRITVEVDPATKSIMQARGLSNREADGEEQRIIARWANAILRSAPRT